MNTMVSPNVVVSREFADFSAGIEGLMCEPEEQYRIGNYLAEQDYEEEWEKQSRNFERVAVLKNVWVEEDKKGKGRGNELVQWFLDEAMERDMEAVFLVADVTERNEFDLVTWYQSFGFTEVARIYGGCPLMRWCIET